VPPRRRYSPPPTTPTRRLSCGFSAIRKHGLAAALHSGDPAYNALPIYFHAHLGPALQMLLRNAETAGAVRGDVDRFELLGAVANLCIPPPGSDDNSRAHRMVALLMDGLRYGAKSHTATGQPR
jgi:hypothetical protein